MVSNVYEVTIGEVRSMIRAWAAVLLTVGLLAAPTIAGDGSGNVFINGIRLQDEIAVVSTRALCGNCNPESLRGGLDFETYAVTDEIGHRRWESSDLESYLAFDATVPTVIFVHGNQIAPGDAKREGLAVYRKLANYAGSGERMRFVIFSWPSARVGRLLYDVRLKAQRTAPAGCQLAWLLDQMPAETPVTLVGFSYGARIITGGLHILAGGSLGHCSLGERVHPQRAPVKAVLIAAALHSNWLGDGQYHGLAMSQVDRMLLVNSCQDVAMRYYRFSTKRGRPQALGLRGPTYLSSAERSKMEQRDVSRSTGSRHDLFLYLCPPGVIGQIAEYASGPAASSLASVNSL
jgi:hypothetical protein